LSFELWRCTECGYVTRAEPKGSIGTIHAHAERHAPGKLLGFELPTTLWMTADPDILDRFVEKIEVKEVVGLES
jgi:hypothetical protein